MSRSRERDQRALITSARFSRSLDTDQRRTRYLWTMALRVACFLAATVTPLPWNLGLLVAAAVLPALAVMLANAIDLRSAPPAPGSDDLTRPALVSSQTVPGTVVDESE